MKILAYLRVSTDLQVESRCGIDAQKDACNKFAEKYERPIDQMFIDEGVSGISSIEERPALRAAIHEISKGDILVVAKRDRIGRDPIIVAMIESCIAKKEAKLVSVAGEGTEGNTAVDVLMRRMIDAFAEFERNITITRIRDAMQAKKKRGERVGYIPFGFEQGDGNKIIPKLSEQVILKKMMEFRELRWSMRDIMRELNSVGMFNRDNRKWTVDSIQHALKNIHQKLDMANV